MTDAEFQYVAGQSRPTFAALLAGFEARSAAAIHTGNCRLDLAYGPAPRQRFDFFVAQGRPRGTLAYFHAGYWQSRDKASFRFIAPAFTRLGLHVALVNYPLCPAVSLGALIEAASAAIGAIGAYAAIDGQHSPPLVLAGHSAGGHIAVELALAQAGRPHAPTPAIAGVVALSGIYDLAPLVGTSLNRNLMLDTASATAHSPLHRLKPGCPAALFAVGADETLAFVEQSRHMCKGWQQAGNDAALEVAPGADHFSVLQQFTEPDTALFGRIGALLDQALG
ncbi:alpha/beta hydrolase [Cupriavidus necator]|uniref:alpha/beta hydrolase n=1 Tax=Cupriavidus necator TaxID=106590 RepID=UPI001C11C421|nr:alpha/beta hydrolase [Cupriavidus necator]